jgi:uncharacterized delta-60 repeat protein
MENTFSKFHRSSAHRAWGSIAVLCSWICATRVSVGFAAAQTPGTLDAGFIQGAGADGFIRVVAVQPDGKILAGGNFSTIRGSASPLVARLNPDGSFDSTFASAFPMPVLAARIYTVGILGDGRMVVAGLFTAIGGTFRTNIARLEANGALDGSFNAMAGPSGLVRLILIEPDGKILIGGEFTTVNNTGRNRIARLNGDGSLDDSFDPASGANDIVRALAVLPTGQVLVGGLFTSFADAPKAHLARVNRDGGLDGSFPAGSGPNGDVYFISAQPDGSVLIGGDFTAVNGVGINRIARLHSDGSLDTAFVPPGGAVGGPVYHVLAKPNGRVVLGGGFTSVNGVSLARLARLNADGSLDGGFNPGSGASDLILSLALQDDGMILAGGLFATYAGTSVAMLARIYGDSSSPTLTAQGIGSHQILLSWPSWASGFLLQTTPVFATNAWQNITNSPAIKGSRLNVTLSGNLGAEFFRLAR